MSKIIDFASLWGTIILLVGFTWGCFVGMADPFASASKFGMNIHDDAGALYFRVFRSRDFTFLILAFILLIRQDWHALAMLMTVSVLLPLFDSVILYRQLGMVTSLIPHIASIGVMSVLAATLWLKALAS